MKSCECVQTLGISWIIVAEEKDNQLADENVLVPWNGTHGRSLVCGFKR